MFCRGTRVILLNKHGFNPKIGVDFLSCEIATGSMIDGLGVDFLSCEIATGIGPLHEFTLNKSNNKIVFANYVAYYACKTANLAGLLVTISGSGNGNNGIKVITSFTDSTKTVQLAAASLANDEYGANMPLYNGSSWTLGAWSLGNWALTLT